MRTPLLALLLAAFSGGLLLAGDAEVPRPPPTDAELVRRVEQLDTDPFRLVTTLYPGEDMQKAAVAPRAAYQAARLAQREAKTAELHAAWLEKIVAVLGDARGKTFLKLDEACAAHVKVADAARAAPGKVLEEVTGQPGAVALAGRPNVVTRLPNLPEETAAKLKEVLSRQRRDLDKEAETRALDGKDRPSMTDREAWSAYRARRRQARTALGQELRPAHLEELTALLNGEQRAALEKITAAVDQAAADREALRIQAVEDLGKVVGVEALIASVERRQKTMAAATKAEPEPVKEEDLPRLLSVPRDPFSVARTFFDLDEESKGKLGALQQEFSTERNAAWQALAEEVAADHLDAALAILPEAEREKFAETYELAWAHAKARKLVEQGYTEAAKAAGLGSTFFPPNVQHLVCLLAKDEPELYQRVQDAMNAESRLRYQEVGEELKRRGVDRNSPDWAEVSAEVNAAVNAAVEGRQLAKARELLGEERAAKLDVLVPVHRAIIEARQGLTLETGKELLELLGAERLMGPPRTFPRRR